MTNNTSPLHAGFHSERKKGSNGSKRNARRVPNFVLDESYAPIQIEDSMFLVRACNPRGFEALGCVQFLRGKRRWVAFCEQMTLERSRGLMGF
ncbi:MAG: hypothetical protein IPM93_24520 [Candidatus Obscuribacter sp.]|nr:hypothetical protein [Candidatus Obscuribacter sp.]